MQGEAVVEPDARAPIYAEMFEQVVVTEAFFIPVARIDSVVVGASEVGDVVWHVGEFFPNPVGISVG